jgi:hypothetical protein
MHAAELCGLPPRPRTLKVKDGEMIAIQQVSADEWREWRELRLRALEEAPEAFSSTLADWERAEESRWRNRLSDVERNLVAELDQLPTGMASGALTAGGVEVMSLWVVSSARGWESPTRSLTFWSAGLAPPRSTE